MVSYSFLFLEKGKSSHKRNEFVFLSQEYPWNVKEEKKKMLKNYVPRLQQNKKFDLKTVYEDENGQKVC